MEINSEILPEIWLRFSNTPDHQNHYPTARLQKGWLMIQDGESLAEEGVGFGVPILKRGIHTIFPGSVSLDYSEVDSGQEIRATFRLNLEETIQRSGSSSLNHPTIYKWKNVFSVFIRRIEIFRKPLTAFSNWVRSSFHLETVYQESVVNETIQLSYRVKPLSGELIVESDLSDLSNRNDQVVIMNEQGAFAFDKYLDSAGNFLTGEDIGCWDRVLTSWAAFASQSKNVTYRLDQIPGVLLYRGREWVPGRLSWSGFGYILPATLNQFKYSVRISRQA